MNKQVIIALLIVLWSAVSVADAQTHFTRGRTGEGSICGKLLNETDKQLGPEEIKAQMRQRATQRRQQRDQQISQKRTQNDQRRGVFYEKLYSIADNEEKKAAVDVFKQEAEAAVFGFQKIQDEISSEFRTKADEIFANVENETESDLDKLQNVQMQVFLNDLKVYCEEGTFTEEEIGQMMREKMMEKGRQGNNQFENADGQMPGWFSIANNQELLEVKNKMTQQLTLARNQMQEAMITAGEKLKASL